MTERSAASSRSSAKDTRAASAGRKGTRAIGSDLKKVDAHAITREEYEEIPELTEGDLDAADVYDGRTLVRRGRPRKADAKLQVSIRLRPTTLAHFKALGKGWQQRVEDILAAVASTERDAGEREQLPEKPAARTRVVAVRPGAGLRKRA
jgi:uncharacterized protein (DUF4415 family)